MTYLADTFADSAVSALAGGAGGGGTSFLSTDTTFTVTAGQGVLFPTTNFMVLFGNINGTYELVRVGSRSVNTFSNCQRGQEGTLAATWAVNTTIQQVVTAGNMNNIWSAINSGRIFNVKDYGAAGDGITDDTTALTNAINAAATPLVQPPPIPTVTQTTGTGPFAANTTIGVAMSWLHYLGETTPCPTVYATILTTGNGLVVPLPSFTTYVFGINTYISITASYTTLYKTENNIIPSNHSGGVTTILTTYASNSYAPAPTVNDTNRGTIYYPAGVYLTGPQTLYSHVSHLGDGHNESVIRLKNNANASLLSAYVTNITNTLGHNGNPQGVYGFFIRDLLLDGNNFGQTAGPSWPLQFYGYGYLLRDISVVNGYSGGIQADYHGNGSQVWSSAGANPGTNNYHNQAIWSNINISECIGISTAPGIQFFGPNDSQWDHIMVQGVNSHGIHIGANANGLQCFAVHPFSTGKVDPNSTSWLVEAIALYAASCESEGNPNNMLTILAGRCNWVGGSIYGGQGNTQAGTGLKIGQVGGTTPLTGCFNQSGGVSMPVAVTDWQIFTRIENIQNTNGYIVFANDGGFGYIQAGMLTQTASSVLYTGTPSPTTSVYLTADGFTNDGRQQIQLQKGVQAWGQSNAAAVVASNGTIPTGTDMISRIVPATNISNAIMAAGTAPGQTTIVLNESSNSISMAVSGTSHVADGTSCTINPLTQKVFTWDTSTSFWYHN